MKKENSSILKKIFGYSIASWFSALISFIVVPISSHVYSADDLGKINFFLSVGSICYTLLCLGLDQGYIRFFALLKEDKKRNQLMSFNLLTVFCVLLAVSSVAIIFWRPVSRWLFGDESPILLLMLPCYVAGLLIIRFISTRYRMLEHLPFYTLLTVLLGIATKGMYLLSAPVSASYQAAVYFCGTAGVCFTVILLITHRATLTRPAIKENLQFYGNELKYALPLIPAMLMSLLNNNISQFMLRSFDGFGYLAGYSVAVTVATALNVVQTGFNTFWTPYVFKNYENNQPQIKQIHGYIVTLMPLLALGIVLFQDVIFLVVNEDYRYITQFLPFLILTPLCYTIGETTCVGIALSMNTGYNIFIYSMSALVNCICCLLLIPNFGANGGAISAAIGALTALTLKTVLGQKFYSTIKSIWPMVINVCMFVAVATMNMIAHESPGKMILNGIAIVLFCLIPHNLKVLTGMLRFACQMIVRRAGKGKH